MTQTRFVPEGQFRDIRQQSTTLNPGQLLFVAAEFTPEQAKEIEDDTSIVWISARENTSLEAIQCLARVEDRDAALAAIYDMLANMGARNINGQQTS